MVNEKDIVDIISGEISDKKVSDGELISYKSGFFTKDKWIKSYSTLTAKKNLITEFEVRKIIVAGTKTLRVSMNTIIGPLALEIIQEKGIKIVRE